MFSVHGFIRINSVILAVAAVHFSLPLANTLSAQEASMIYHHPRSDKGDSLAITIPDQPLAHTIQVLPTNASGALTAQDISGQTVAVLDRIDRELKEVQSGLRLAVKLNFYVTTDSHSDAVYKILAARFSGTHKPAVSMVVTALPLAGALVAADAVATLGPTAHGPDAVHHHANVSVLPAGSRIYVAGQAEQSSSLTEATTKTLASLSATLKFLERSDADIVQLKAFLMPMTDANTVRDAVSKYYTNQQIPPLILVEWKSSATTPVEIELVAWGGEAVSASPVLEFITPPGMTTSPVYSRVCRINSGDTIFTSGLFATTPSEDTDRNSATAGEREVREIYSQLQKILGEAGSDLTHLVKATYYVSTDAASSKLNELRPGYYDPQRPPAASKAAVSSVGHARLGLTVDMIAVPSGKK